MNLNIKKIRLLGVAGLAAALTLASTACADDFQTWQAVSLKWRHAHVMGTGLAFSL